ncbi:hypothetical protein ONE63_011170 [Megalurothrips usitatus]|uniref:ATP-dependent DNA helicase n=1 Tax=Megalurothrips usitatus TaxID=439358 RepID=A0AAV7X008_9NEOP|nr:hypothetical protein ONE63_011170 [Megalurothrips usitatus]
MGASDAAWRILEFDLTGRDPTVECVPVHLDGQRIVSYRRGHEDEALAKDGKLEWYFNRPAAEVFDNVKYADFYENYRVHTKKPVRAREHDVWESVSGGRFVTRRQRGECVVRLFWVSPHRGELYYLRLLLSNFPCRSYADLYLLGGPDCKTFQEAACAMGLLDNEKEYSDALQEAHTFLLGNALRRMFVLLCNIGAPAAVLWEQHRDILSEDLFEGDENRERAYNQALIQIDRGLRRGGSNNVMHGLPDVVDDNTELGRERTAYSMDALKREVDEWLPRLSDEQRNVFNYIKLIVQQSQSASPITTSPNAVFLDAPGGCGKTLLCRVITAYLRLNKTVVICAASSGIAALNYDGGRTAHSTFGFPLEITDPRGVWSHTNGSQRGQFIKAAGLIIYDEVTMADRGLIEMMDRSLRDLMGSTRLFGGKPVMFCGDFRQLAPIVKGYHNEGDVVNASLISSRLWGFMKKMKLTVGQRCTDPEYSKHLLEIGEGRAPEHTFRLSNVEGDERTEPLIAIDRRVSHTYNVEELIAHVFPDEVLQNPDQCADRAILCTHNINVAATNELILGQLETEERELLSADSLALEAGDQADLYDIELLHQTTAKGVPPHVLKLKTGALCMIMRNLNSDDGLVNGAKVIIVQIGANVILIRRPGSPEVMALPRITFKFPIFDNSHVQMTRRQFPLQIAYAMSIHKSQGQTIRRCALDLRSGCFAHGQLYVALSRVPSPESLLILTPERRVRDGQIYARNIVYKNLIHRNSG